MKLRSCLKIMLVRFDVVVGNPPYNGNDTQRKNSTRRGQGDNLAKQFTVKALDLLKEGGEMVFIIPYGHRTYSPRLAEKYRKNGLYKIEDVSDSFKGVTTNPCAFHFKKGQVVDLVEDQYNAHTRIIPTNNIGNIFRNQPGVLNRIDFEHKLKDTGKYRIVVTTAIQKYTDDKTIVDRMKDKTQGTWRVVFNCTTSKGNFGKIIVESPSSVLSKSVHCLICESKEQAEQLKTYLETTDVQQILADVKLNACNSKKFLKYIPMPTKSRRPATHSSDQSSLRRWVTVPL